MGSKFIMNRSPLAALGEIALLILIVCSVGFAVFGTFIFSINK